MKFAIAFLVLLVGQVTFAKTFNLAYLAPGFRMADGSGCGELWATVANDKIINCAPQSPANYIPSPIEGKTMRLCADMWTRWSGAGSARYVASHCQSLKLKSEKGNGLVNCQPRPDTGFMGTNARTIGFPPIPQESLRIQCVAIE